VVVGVVVAHLFALNVLYPKVLGSRLQLNPLAVTVSLLLWGFLWGGVGLVLAIPMTAAMKIIFEHVDRLQPLSHLLGEGNETSG
jgi:predicted PurR-regulated permease PerM